MSLDYSILEGGENDNSPLVRHVSALAAAGKTYSALDHAIHLAGAGERVIIAQPSMACIEEWAGEAARRAGSRPLSIRRFDTVICGEGRVTRAIMSCLANPIEHGQVVFMTQQALLRLPYFHRPGDWHLIVDEIPAVDVTFCKHLPRNHQIITSAISWMDFSAENVRVIANDRAQLTRLAQNEGGDAIDAEFQAIARAILSDDYDVFAIRENIERTVRGDTEGGRYPLYLFGLLRPEAFLRFKSATIMGAHFEQSLLYLLWSAQGVRFEPHERICQGLRFQDSHPNGRRLEVRYVTDEHWSKRLGRKKAEDGEASNTMTALKAAAAWFDGAPFLYQVNKDSEDAAAALFSDLAATPLPHKPHGMNGFSDLDNVVVVASFLPPPMQFRFLRGFGISAEDIREAVCYETVYQVVMRCSLRDLSRHTPVRILVTDEGLATWLAEQFPGCTLAAIPGAQLSRKERGHGRKCHADGAARSRAHRERKREQLEEIELAQLLPEIQNGQVSALRLVNKDYSPNVSMKSDQNEEVISEKYFIDFSVLEKEVLVGTLFTHKRDMDVSRHLFANLHEDAITWLRMCHEFRYTDKHHNFLISPALFNPGAAADTKRGRGNVIIASGIWLDIDDGDLRYTDFAKMFCGIRLVTYNTASSADETRFRAYFPTVRYMMAETYHAICRQIVSVVESNGYCSPRQKKRGSSKPCHGIDATKLQAENMMYLPCQPMEGGSPYFEDYAGTLLDPHIWLSNNILPLPLSEAPLPVQRQ